MKTETVKLPRPDFAAPTIYEYTADQMREYAAQVAAAENYGLLSLLFDIRVAAGDKDGRLMQDELVARIAGLRVGAERYQWLAKQARMDPDMGGNHRWHSICLRGDVRGATLDAAIDAARSEKPA
jgi:hypothetical protein